MTEEKSKSKEELIQELENLQQRAPWLVEAGGTEYQSIEEKLKKSEEIYRTVFLNNPDYIYLNDVDGFFLDANPATLQVHGLSLEEFQKKSFLDYFAGGNLEELIRVAEGLREGRPVYGLKLRIRTARSEFIEMEINAVPLFENGQVVSVLSLARDITARVNAEAKLKQAYEEMEARVTQRTVELVRANQGLRAEIAERKRSEEAFRESEEIYRTLVETSPDAIITSDLESRITGASQRALEIFGTDKKEDLVGKMSFELTDPKEHLDMRKNISKLREVKAVRSVERTLFRIDDTSFVGEVSAAPLKDVRGTAKGLFITIRDITERKRLEKEILEISAREQRRIGHNLHDGLGQHLTAISFMNKVLENKLAAKSPAEAREAAKISRLISDAISQTRNLARGINPVELKADGLMASLRQLSVNLENLFKVSCQFQCRKPVLVGDNIISTNLYYIAQEAANNAIKHGKAKQVKIRLAVVRNKLTLSVSDDGVGVPKKFKRNGGLGLQIMNYRSKIIGANLSIQAGRKGGTTVACSLRPPAKSLH